MSNGTEKNSPTIFQVQSKRIYKNWSLWIAIIISLPLSIISFYTVPEYLYNILESIIPYSQAILLTFVGLGATIYAIIWGFSQQKVIEILLIIPDQDPKYSVYQTIISLFGYHVLVYIYSLSIQFVIFVCSVIYKETPFIISNNLSVIINTVAIFSILFSTIYPILLLHDAINSTFSFIDIYKEILLYLKKDPK
ncbi:MAG: hypothetical protein ACRCR9_03800 [Chitinophagaceae bacterium]